MYYVTRKKLIPDFYIKDDPREDEIWETWQKVFKNNDFREGLAGSRTHIHRLKGPSFITIDKNNKIRSKCWYAYGVIYSKKKEGLFLKKCYWDSHELMMPSIIRNDGTKEWYITYEAINGPAGTRVLHREEDKPAIEHANGDREWYRFGKRHRANGPALIVGDKQYFYQFGELVND